jgi:hypothetical protein
MSTTLDVLRPPLALCVMLIALQGCDGHGGGGSAPQASPSGDANPAGLWQGGFTAADGTTRGFTVIAAPDGLFVGVIASSGTNGRFVIGTGDTTLGTFTATGRVFAQAGEALLPNGQASDALTVPSGNIVERVSLKGSYSGGGESASFALGYDDGLTSRGASLEAIAGVYDVYPPPLVNTATLVVNGSSLTFASDGGCNGAGTIAVIDPTMNIYSWSMQIGACGGLEEDDLSGLATLADNPRTGGTRNLIGLYGATPNQDRSFVFRGFK